ncbi:MAG: hypothetical protein WCG47_20295, partial [Dermatophilaceae bacterium]
MCKYSPEAVSAPSYQGRTAQTHGNGKRPAKCSLPEPAAGGAHRDDEYLVAFCLVLEPLHAVPLIPSSAVGGHTEG